MKRLYQTFAHCLYEKLDSISNNTLNKKEFTNEFSLFLMNKPLTYDLDVFIYYNKNKFEISDTFTDEGEFKKCFHVKNIIIENRLHKLHIDMKKWK